MLKLTDVEKRTARRLLNEWGHDALLDIEEDCCGAASYHFEVHPSGIGDTVYLVFRGHRECISDLDNF